MVGRPLAGDVLVFYAIKELRAIARAALTAGPPPTEVPGRITTVLALLAFVLPLGLDSFAVSAALGARRPTAAQRWRLSALFASFEAGMPLIGLALGAPIAHLIGSAADFIAAAVLFAVGTWMLLGNEADEDQTAERILTTHGWAVVGIGISISVDELAIGFTLGLTHLPIVAVIIAIAVQAIVASQLGLALGARIGEAWRERAEQAAAVLLVLLGLVLVAVRIVGYLS
jgi:putative Mn2+ efflux pump MntP